MARLTVFIAGTDTEVGKTWVATRLIEDLRAHGLAVTARKSVQSFDPEDGATDADLLAAAAGVSPEEVTPPRRWYRLAMAPPMAADALEEPEIKVADLVDETALPNSGIVIVEGVGGPRSPLAHDGDNVSFAAALAVGLVVLVADAGLGVVNSVTLSAEAFASAPTVVYLNRFDPHDDLHERNRQWLSERGSHPVVTDIEELSAFVMRTHERRGGQ